MSTASDTISDLTERAEEVIGRKGTQFAKFLDDVEDLLRHVTELEGEAISRARDRVESSISAVRQTAERGVHRTVEQTKAAARATDTFVHESPWTAIGIAAVAGLVIASIVRSR